MPSTIQFPEIPIGQHFEFRGRRYQKLTLGMASDEDRNGTSFHAQTEVLPAPFALQASSPEVARFPQAHKPQTTHYLSWGSQILA